MEKQLSQKSCEILDFLHQFGDSTVKQIAHEARVSEYRASVLLRQLIALDLVGITNARDDEYFWEVK